VILVIHDPGSDIFSRSAGRIGRRGGTINWEVSRTRCLAGSSAERSGVRQGDDDLAERAARGDRAAFHQIVDRYAHDLFRLARSLSRSADDADDIVQETFVAAFRGLGKFDRRSSLKTWLSRIAIKLAAKAWNKGRRSRQSISLDVPAEATELEPRLTTSGANARVDARLDLLQVLPTLTAEYREVLVLRELQSMSYAEIAQTLGLPQGTVESRLHRGRCELREKLAAYRE
jgi:RNA polymerase sigma factor (sigma-70 family)